MDKDWEEKRAGFRATLDQHQQAMQVRIRRARAQVEAVFERVEAEFALCREEYDATMAEVRARMDAVRRGQKDPGAKPAGRGRRPRPRGGHPLPVEPAPKPKPLVGGAEAPID